MPYVSSSALFRNINTVQFEMTGVTCPISDNESFGGFLVTCKLYHLQCEVDEDASDVSEVNSVNEGEAGNSDDGGITDNGIFIIGEASNSGDFGIVGNGTIGDGGAGTSDDGFIY